MKEKTDYDNSALGSFAQALYERRKNMCKATEEELESIEWDESGAKYSNDGKKLLKVDEYAIDVFFVKVGTEIICDEAFYNCKKLKTICIFGGVRGIGENAFKGCSKLTSIDIPSSVFTIKNDIFEDCAELSSIFIKNDAKQRVLQLLPSKFHELLKEVDDKSKDSDRFKLSYGDDRCFCQVAEEEFNSIEWDESDAKYSRDGKRLIKVGDSVEGVFAIKPNTKIICDKAFSECNEITSIIIPKGVLFIGENAFCECKKLSSVVIPPGIIHITHNAFESCNSISEIYVTNGVTNYFKTSFPERLQDKLIEDSIAVEQKLHEGELLYLCNASDKEIESIEWDETGAKYSKDGLRLLKVNSDIKGSFSIKNGVKIICNYAFNIVISHGVDVTSVFLPSSVTVIGKNAFEGCRNLTSINIPKRVTIICNNAFDLCVKLNTIEIPSNVIEIGDYAFSCCRDLMSMTIPSSTIRIGVGIFLNCINLEKIIVDSKNPKYGNYDSCNAIIDNDNGELIAGCKNTIIPKGVVTSIGENAFWGCTNLTSISIPMSVTRIANSAFFDCRRLTSISLPSTMSSIGSNAFSDCCSITSISIPTSVSTIEYGTFSGCSSLISMHIPTSVTNIGNHAFYYCRNLTSITLSSSIAHIGKDAFSGCKKLSSIIIAKNSKQHFIDILPVELHSKLVESESAITEKQLKPDKSKISNNNKKHNTMYCNNCGKEIPNGSKFCNYCGAKVGASQNIQIVDYLRKIVPNTKLKKVVFASIVLLVIGLLIFRSNTIYGKWQCIHTFSNFYYTDIYEFNLDGTYVCAEYWSSNNSYGERTGTWDNDDGTLMLVDSDGEYPIQYYKIKDVGFNHLTLELLGDQGNTLYEFERK